MSEGPRTTLPTNEPLLRILLQPSQSRHDPTQLLTQHELILPRQSPPSLLHRPIHQLHADKSLVPVLTPPVDFGDGDFVPPGTFWSPTGIGPPRWWSPGRIWRGGLEGRGSGREGEFPSMRKHCCWKELGLGRGMVIFGRHRVGWRKMSRGNRSPWRTGGCGWGVWLGVCLGEVVPWYLKHGIRLCSDCLFPQ